MLRFSRSKIYLIQSNQQEPIKCSSFVIGVVAQEYIIHKIKIVLVHTCARGVSKGHKYPPPLKTQVKTPIPPLAREARLSKIGFVWGWMTEISGLSPPLKSQVQTVIPPLSNPSLHTYGLSFISLYFSSRTNCVVQDSKSAFKKGTEKRDSDRTA